MKSRIIPFEEFNIIILEVTKEYSFQPYVRVYEYYIQDSNYSEFHYVFGSMKKFYKPELRNLIINGYFGMGYQDIEFEELNLDE